MPGGMYTRGQVRCDGNIANVEQLPMPDVHIDEIKERQVCFLLYKMILQQ